MACHIFTQSMANTTLCMDTQTLEMREGDLPVRAQRLVREWSEQYQQELLRMWHNNEFKQLPGLE